MFRKQVVIALLGVAWGTAAAVAQQGSGSWVGDSRTGCKVWGYASEANRTVTWSGACVGGYASGRGVVEWFAGGRLTDRYEGDMVEGTYHGTGSYAFPNGDRYQGGWSRGLQEGHGSYVSNGWRYDGDYAEGLPSGHGAMVLQNGDRYEGDFAANLPHGAGTARIGRETYAGNWVKGCFKQGNRRMTWIATAADCGF